jgi:hypothetical protein
MSRAGWALTSILWRLTYSQPGTILRPRWAIDLCEQFPGYIRRRTSRGHISNAQNPKFAIDNCDKPYLCIENANTAGSVDG